MTSVTKSYILTKCFQAKNCDFKEALIYRISHLSLVLLNVFNGLRVSDKILAKPNI